MPQFPQRDLTNQFISTSYQDVVQRFAPTGSNAYLLDGLGYSILAIPTSSVGGIVLTQDQTASYALSCSYALNGGSSGPSISSSWASSSISSSYSYNSQFSDDALVSVVSQFASQSFTASYILGNEVDGTVKSSSYSPTQLPDITDNVVSHYIGINQTNPQYTLDVNGNFSCDGNEIFTDGTGILNVYKGVINRYNLFNIADPNYGNSWVCGTGGVGGSNFGINNSSPIYSLDVYGSIGNSYSGNPYFIGDGFNTDINGNNYTYFNNGYNVGIATSTPSYMLDVNGQIGNSTGGAVFIPQVLTLGVDESVSLYSANSFFGINQNNPSYTLDVNGNIGNSAHGNNNYIQLDNGIGEIVLTTNNNGLIIDNSCNIYDTGNNYNLGVNGNNSYLNANGGNVGVLTTSPAFTLDVNGVVNANQFNLGGNPGLSMILGYNGSQNKQLWMGDPAHLGDSSYAFYRFFMGKDFGSVALMDAVQGDGGGILDIGIVPYGGQVGIGTVSPSHLLDVGGDINFTGNLLTNGTAGLTVTLPYQKTLTTAGTMTFTNGILTAHT